MENNLRYLLLNCLLLLYRESQMDSQQRSVELARNVITSTKTQDTQFNAFDRDTRVLNNLKTMVLNMCEDSNNHIYEETELLQRLRIVCETDDALYAFFEEGIIKPMDENRIKRYCVNLRHEIQRYFRDKKAEEAIFKAANDLRYGRDKIESISKYLAEHIATIEPFTTDTKDEDDAVISRVSFDNVSEMTPIFKEVSSEAAGESVLRVGWQCINRMFRGGFRQPETILIGALQHKWKTGFSLSLFKHIALYNKPKDRHPGKKPLLLRISFEDPLNKNMLFLYASLKENETRVKLTDEELRTTPPEEMAEYVHGRLRSNGWHIEMLYVDPTRWSYLDLFNTIIGYEARGYDIQCLALDYLNLITKAGCTATAGTGSDVRDLLRRVRNFCAQRGALFLNPHQLSTDALNLLRDERINFIQFVAQKGYWDSCKTIGQEADGEIYIHIEERNGEFFLTIQRGKHRMPGVVPQKDLYAVLPFKDLYCGILDDVDLEDSSFSKLGSQGKVDNGDSWFMGD